MAGRCGDQGLDLGGAQAWGVAAKQGHSSRHLGGGHRGSTHVAVLIASQGGEHIHPCGGDVILGCGSRSVRESSQVAVGINGANGDADFTGIGAWVARIGAAVIAGSHDHHRAQAGGIADGVEQHGAGGGATQAEVDHLGAIVRRIANAVGDPCVAAAAAGIQHSHRHDSGVVGNTDLPNAIVFSRDDARHVGAVVVEIHRGVVIVDEIPAANVVDKTVAIIVDAVAGDFPTVAPDVGVKVDVVVVNARVDNGHCDASAGDAGGPDLRCTEAI